MIYFFHIVNGGEDRGVGITNTDLNVDLEGLQVGVKQEDLELGEDKEGIVNKGKGREDENSSGKREGKGKEKGRKREGKGKEKGRKREGKGKGKGRKREGKGKKREEKGRKWKKVEENGENGGEEGY
jgi:hypothetical protein